MIGLLRLVAQCGILVGAYLAVESLIYTYYAR